MFPEAIVIAVFSAAVGGILPILKEFIETLQKQSHGEKFFKSRMGRALLKVTGLDKKPDSPALLFDDLSKASSRMDEIVSRIQEYTQAREAAVAKLEEKLGALSAQEDELRKTVENLKQVPLPAAEYFATLVNKGEKSSAWRDYILFTAGVVVSAIVGIVLKHFGLA